MSKGKAKQVTLESLPRVGALHSWADYVELLCLFNVDREMTRDVLIDRFKERRDTGEALSEDDEEDQVGTEILTDDAVAERTEDIFRHLKYREAAFGKSYPFAVDMTHRRLTLRKTTGACRLYLFLSLASNLRYFRNLTHRLTGDFEALGRVALESMLPETAKVYFFHGAGRKSGRYKGKLHQKLTLLSADIFETINVGEDDFESHDVGDAGLDLVAWVPVGDTSPGLLLCFAQCACTAKWETKQREPLGLRQIMTLKALPAAFTFIPFCFRRPTGDWFFKHKVDSILIDRLRMTHLLTEPSKYTSLSSFSAITAVIKGAEAII